ncbi:pyrroline-5-carboxylate reductase family protein [Hoeflea prorocentri]|uniref:Pyrroline-5-carboxylate reductase n=1 Tax=Hoeflea prorocentri TaxID=1922333 RepID=A0A9X3ZJB2_9HYPH|nr:pyrroline-5-carboxylate reductase dimerization domain-containing protein [Hoeflea prorocentri]MCY6383742.1 NAD(P)-binding domain-containing protein [Hoeflea prorocentri]MDA5401542.1 NAD(P)-binding domain-containing protein [Hoeflea prorocentri]
MGIVIIGGGAMGRAMYDGWINAGVPENSIAVADLNADLCCGSADFLLRDTGQSKMVVLAVKPQYVASVLEAHAQLLNPGDIVTSVAAGVRLTTLNGLVSDTVVVARAMPNLAVALNSGTIGIAIANGVSEAMVQNLTSVYDKLGKSFCIDEQQIDSFTAIAGSGPAYFFQFVEHLAANCAHLDIHQDIADSIVTQVMVGAAAMLADTDLPGASELRNRVTSQEGTTEAGLKSLEANGVLSQLVKNCLIDARERARELSEIEYRHG